MTILLFILGLAVLILGAELFVRGASRLALTFGISPLVVGLTVVAIGTSSPELAVSVQSAWSGQVDLALGNVVGSNVFNVLFILGLSAMIMPLVVHQQLTRREVPLMIGVSLLLWALAADGGIERWEGLLLALGLVAYLVYAVRASRRETAQIEAQYADAIPGNASRWDQHWSVQSLLVLGGLALLVVGSNQLIESAVVLARAMGVSEL